MTVFPWSLAVTGAVLAPNLAFLAFPPRNVEAIGPGTAPRVLSVLERIGQVSCFTLPLFSPLSWVESVAPAWIVMAGCLGLYYAGWVRYFARGRDFALLYRSLVGIPIPMALAPILYFGAASVVLGSWPMAGATAVLAVGHLGISWKEYLRTKLIQNT